MRTAKFVGGPLDGGEIPVLMDDQGAQLSRIYIPRPPNGDWPTFGGKQFDPQKPTPVYDLQADGTYAFVGWDP